MRRKYKSYGDGGIRLADDYIIYSKLVNIQGVEYEKAPQRYREMTTYGWPATYSSYKAVESGDPTKIWRFLANVCRTSFYSKTQVNGIVDDPIH